MNSASNVFIKFQFDNFLILRYHFLPARPEKERGGVAGLPCLRTSAFTGTQTRKLKVWRDTRAKHCCRFSAARRFLVA